MMIRPERMQALRLNLATRIHYAAFVPDPNRLPGTPSPGWCWEKSSDTQKEFCFKQADFALQAIEGSGFTLLDRGGEED